MKANRFITFLLCCVLISSCDVHEFPEITDFTLHLDYSTEMPLYQVVEYTEETRSAEISEEYDIRYIVNLYDKNTSSREVLHSFSFIVDDVAVLDTSLTMAVPYGEYRFVVWTDYVQQGNEADLYYNTEKFEYISLAGEDHVGNQDMRDAFTGTVTATVSKTSLEANVSMTRPLAKFNFITTDVEEFVARAYQARGLSDLEDYKIIFRYVGFMPFAYNLHASGNVDTSTGAFFESTISQLNEAEAELGFDYVFVNEYETTVNVSIEVYDIDGKQLSASKPVSVPLVRSKLTTVKANFLTTSASGGATIDPGYNGDINIQVK